VFERKTHGEKKKASKRTFKRKMTKMNEVKVDRNGSKK